MKGSSERLSFWGRAEKKVLSVIALSAIGASALAGCGSPEKAPRDEAQPTQSAAAAEATSSATPTTNPSIEAPADKKTPQPKRSHSTDKATEIPSPSHSASPETTPSPTPNETESNQEKMPSVAELAKAVKEGSVDVLGGVVKDVDEVGNGYVGVRPFCYRKDTGFGHGSGKIVGLYTVDMSTGTLRLFDTKLPMFDKYGSPISTSVCNELTFDESKTFGSSSKKAGDGNDVYIQTPNGGERIPVGADITGDDSSDLIRVGGTAEVQGNVPPSTLLEPIPRETMEKMVKRAQQQVS
ncbi:MAG: hypothetical protein Q4B27_04180 [Candidatus Saccharibacteria bacterium]|nr:hypothetical protein [Candidatus Saccharibacteria bacterium]